MSNRRIEIVVEFTDEAWADIMEPYEGYEPTEEEQVEYFVEYAEGAYMHDGVTYSGRLV